MMRKMKHFAKWFLALVLAVAMSVPALNVQASQDADMFDTTTTIKGVQGVSSYKEGPEGNYEEKIVDSGYGTQHRLINMNILDCYERAENEWFVNGWMLPFNYKGKDYYFSIPGHVYNRIKLANEGGETISVVFLMNWQTLTKDNETENAIWAGQSYPEEVAWLIDDAARTHGHMYYAPETEGAAGEWLEAFFAYFASVMAEDGLHVDNYILGNEVNMPNSWHYTGSVDPETCATKYADAFRIMYNSVKSYFPEARLSISLDHSWTHNDEERGIAGKDFLNRFANRLDSVQTGIDWCVSYHLYPAILFNTDFWNSEYSWLNGLTQDALFIDGKNLFYMTNYIKQTFGEQHRVMLTEQGFSNHKGAAIQAASLAYSYYAAMYDPMVDCFIINTENAGTAANGESLNFTIEGTLAGEVYKKIGNGNAEDQQWIADTCLPVIGVSSWEEIIPYFGTESGSGSTPEPEIDPAYYEAVFDAEYYYNNNGDIKAAMEFDEEALLKHFVENGMAEGRVASAEFDINAYKKYNTDLTAAFGDDNEKYYLHYITDGKAEGRTAVEIGENTGDSGNTGDSTGGSTGGSGNTGDSGSTDTGVIVEITPMYRLYNPNSGEHFYTGSTVERDNLVVAGWVYEGIAWNAPTKTGDPVYRLYNPNSGDHHYTMSIEERDMLVGYGWQYEGVCWNSASSDNLPQYRLYNPNADCGSHHYTGSTVERDYLVSVGWIYEGIGWFGTEQ